jgi:hydroxymethylbilane synthase
MSAPSRRLRIATRESRLALRQAELVSTALAARHPCLEIEIVGMTTSGDRVCDRPLRALRPARPAAARRARGHL